MTCNVHGISAKVTLQEWCGSGSIQLTTANRHGRLGHADDQLAKDWHCGYRFVLVDRRAEEPWGWGRTPVSRSKFLGSLIRGAGEVQVTPRLGCNLELGGEFRNRLSRVDQPREVASAASIERLVCASLVRPVRRVLEWVATGDIAGIGTSL